MEERHGSSQNPGDHCFTQLNLPGSGNHESSGFEYTLLTPGAGTPIQLETVDNLRGTALGTGRTIQFTVHVELMPAVHAKMWNIIAFHGKPRLMRMIDVDFAP